MHDQFDFSSPAELFPSRRYAKSLARYRRFSNVAEAVRYVIEETPEGWMTGTFLVVEERRYEGHAIRALYDLPSYPLLRLKAAA